MSISSANAPRLDFSHEIEKRYKDALKILESVLGRDPWVLALGNQLIRECEGARLAPDPFQIARKEDKEALREARNLISAAKKIATYMRHFPFHGGMIAASALLALPKNGIKCTFEASPTLEENETARAFEHLANELAKSADKHNPARKGNWLWRVAIPGAVFPTPIDDPRQFKRHPDTATVLAFHLVLWLRAATTGGGLLVCPGLSMPKSGKPHYRIAQEFVACALNKDIDVQQRLRAHPKMQYGSWEYPTAQFPRGKKSAVHTR